MNLTTGIAKEVNLLNNLMTSCYLIFKIHINNKVFLKSGLTMQPFIFVN